MSSPEHVPASPELSGFAFGGERHQLTPRSQLRADELQVPRGCGARIGCKVDPGSK